MTIHDKSAFEDAQIMARVAAAKAGGVVANESFWAAAMLALKEAYKG